MEVFTSGIMFKGESKQGQGDRLDIMRFLNRKFCLQLNVGSEKACLLLSIDYCHLKLLIDPWYQTRWSVYLFVCLFVYNFDCCCSEQIGVEIQGSGGWDFKTRMKSVSRRHFIATIFLTFIKRWSFVIQLSSCKLLVNFQASTTLPFHFLTFKFHKLKRHKEISKSQIMQVLTFTSKPVQDHRSNLNLKAFKFTNRDYTDTKKAHRIKSRSKRSKSG